jgi:endonuclease/exonuclease/phosphatase family metal-dependent hydrolase
MTTITVLSWNILSQSCIDESKLAQAWQVRLPKIINVLQKSNADIILLQEVDLEHFETNFDALFGMYQYERHKIILKGKRARTNPFGNVTMWRIGTLLTTTITSRCLHVELMLSKSSIMVTNVHFPAKNGLEGYKEKLKHFISCTKIWKDSIDIIFGGDFNDGLCFKNEIGEIIGLGSDVKEFKFEVPIEELQKNTCKSTNGKICNVDHILVRGNLKAVYLPWFDVNEIPDNVAPRDVNPVENSHLPMVTNACTRESSRAQSDNLLPSDHIPILYKITIPE